MKHLLLCCAGLVGLLPTGLSAEEAAVVLWGGRPQRVTLAVTNRQDHEVTLAAPARLWLGRPAAMAPGPTAVALGMNLPPRATLLVDVAVTPPEVTRVTPGRLACGGSAVPVEIIPRDLLAGLPQPVVLDAEALPAVATALHAAGVRLAVPGEPAGLAFTMTAWPKERPRPALVVRFQDGLPAPLVERANGHTTLLLPTAAAAALADSAAAQLSLWRLCEFALKTNEISP